MQIDGNKTYAFSALIAVFAVAGYLTGQFQMATAVELVAGSGVIVGFRHAIEKVLRGLKSRVDK